MEKKQLKIDKSILPSGYSTEKKEWFYAEFYPDGQLKHFGFYMKGSLAGNWQLNLSQGKEEGEAIRVGVSGDKIQEYVYKDGVEKYVCGRGSNLDSPTPKPFVQFIKKWVNEIWNGHKHEIGFDPDNPFTDKEYRQWDVNMRSLRMGMNSDEAIRLIKFDKNLEWRLNLLDTVKGRTDQDSFESEYGLKHGYGIRLWDNLKSGRVTNFELFGEGWSKETREIVERNRKVK